MAKKVRRVRQPRAVSPSDENGEEAKTALKTRLNPEAQFRQEYAYVLKDLRQILVLAILMFGLLIALNLILR